MSTWYDLMHHVVTLVGGYTQRIHGKRDPGPVRTMVPAEKQREAMRFLLEEDFVPPTWLRDPALSRLLPEAWRRQIGRASCRERVCRYGSIPVVAGSLKKKQK